MTVSQRPAALCFAAEMHDYIIDTDSTISFAIKYNGSVILSEEYSPDSANQVKIRKLGRLCRLALWGQFTTGAQDHAIGTFEFLIDGTSDGTSTIIFSSCVAQFEAKDSIWLSHIRQKVTRTGQKEYLSCYIPKNGTVTLVKSKASGDIASIFYTHVSDKGIVTLDVSPSVIGDCQKYTLTVGTDKFSFYMDETRYIDTYTFRYRNMFEMMETVTIVGGLKLKGNDESAVASMWGVSRKFEAKCTDEYTANSGVIFMQSDYKLWHDFFLSQEVEILSAGHWYKVVISKQNYERTFRKSVLKAVEFTFKMADVDENGVIEV